MRDNEEIRSTIDCRILCLRLQLTQTLTPLLRKETKLVMDVHSAALEEHDLAAEKDLLRNLTRIHDQLIDHWCKVYKHPLYHSFLLTDMIQFQTELTGMLLHDYLGESYSPTTWLFNRVEALRQKNAAVERKSPDHLTQTPDSDGSEADASGGSEADGDSNDWRGSYHDGVVFPLEEMTLNVAHAEERLLFVGSEQQEGLSGAGYVTELIRRTDWKKLAETLLNDRELAGQLSLLPMIDSCLDDKKSRKVLDGIKKIEHKYFADLSSPTTYTISKHAMDLSATYPSSSCGRASFPLVGPGSPTDVSRKNRARNVFSAIAGGVKGRGPSSPKGNARASVTSADTSRIDEKALLVDLEDS